ncbi:MAG: NAD(P)H-dependent oxidoreductase [Chloroflexota bacterium]|nr:NAD(P)H-dependent oxidoreductase [Chloroflexota bacterium]
MSKIVIIYDSRSGNTEKMALEIAEGAKQAGSTVDLKKVDEAKPHDLLDADGIILGSPNHFGSMSAKMQTLISDSVAVRKKLENKVGAAFCSAGALGGGGETTLFSLIQAMMIHSMIIIGDPMSASGHYGAVGVGAPDEKTSDTCRKLGQRVSELAQKLA